MGHATFSFDVAQDSPARTTIFAAVRAATGTRTTWRLLTRQWMIRFASIADFEGFAGELEALHASHPREFDYFALHFDAAGGPVVIAPNPNRRTPAPIPGAARGAAPLAAAANEPPASVAVDDPGPTLSRLRDLHAFDDWEARADGAPGARRTRRAAKRRRPGAAARGGNRRKRGGRKPRRGRR